MCQQLAESERGESEYGISDTVFAEERENHCSLGKSHKVTNQSYDNIDPPHFPYPTSDMLAEEGEGEDF